MSQSLLLQVKTDIQNFLNCRQTLFYNEQDFQAALGVWLKCIGNYNAIYFEYPVEIRCMEGILQRRFTKQEYPWTSKNDTTLYIDLVVERNGEFVPIELKYKTKSTEEPWYPFNQIVKSSTVPTLLESHGAHPMNKYLVWKDIHRLEILHNIFDNVVGGISVFVTNDINYWDETKQGGNGIAFSTGGTKMEAGPKVMTGKMGNECPSFNLMHNYDILWQDMEQLSSIEEFRYCIFTVCDDEHIKANKSQKQIANENK